MNLKIAILLLLVCCTPHETGKITVFFCNIENCSQVINQNLPKNYSCAIYNPGNDFPKGGKLIVDEEFPKEGAIMERGKGLMHNKFCVFEDKVFTGSWNPNQKDKIPNNLVLIQSKSIAKAYQNEFEELWDGTFHKGKKGSQKVFINNSRVEVYFCPEDNCKKAVMKELENAKESIQFMQFSFTDKDIADVIKEKVKGGVAVSGIIDPRKNQYSQYKSLEQFTEIRKSHHKVFIIDGKIVITGSYNPSKNANELNDENVVIIEDSKIAEKFIEEFNRLT